MARWPSSCPPARAAGHFQAKTGALAGGDLLNQRLILPSQALGGSMDTPSNRKLQASYLVVNNVQATSIDDVLLVKTDLGRIAVRFWGPGAA